MFNIKRIGAIVAAAALLVTLTACGTKDDTNTTEPAPTTQSQETAEPTKEPSSNDEYAWVSDVKPLLAELGWEIHPDYTSIGCATDNEPEWNRVCVPMLEFDGHKVLQPMRFEGDGEAMQMRFTDTKKTLFDPINPRAEDGIVPPAFGK